MSTHLPYLFCILTLGVLPSIIVWICFWSYLKQYGKVFLIGTICAVLWGFFFDVVGIHWGVWFYTHTLGISYFGLPLEEYILLLLVPQQVIALLLLVRRKIYG
jgi:hypothetical protein